jgi:Mg2+/Co2+ transporter CorB
MSGTEITELAIAVCLVPIGGALACFDSALTHVSPARVEEMVREGRPGAKRLQRIAVDRARYTNLLLLLRVICELTATVLATVFASAEWGGDWPVIVYTVAVMVVVSYVIIGVGPPSRSARPVWSICSAGSSTRSPRF